MSQVKGSDGPILNRRAEIAARLQELRGRRTQEECSQRWDIPLGTLKRYFAGKTSPDAVQVAAISDIEGVSADWLLRGIGGMQIAEPGARYPIPGVTDQTGVDVSGFDKELLAACLEALYKRERFRNLSSADKAKAVLALYDLSLTQKENPIALLNAQKNDD